ncbi:MAG: molybdopterin molybdotransferase MoeA [Azospirillum sp.]|nr:molybdopterin molybdotransferase MoeA [Azospirillum sp.]MCZ8124716.1 molybdopterin molybdotransferase MoeA [Magnetospirillum sp.]
MIPVGEAQSRILAALTPVGAETVGLDRADGRTLAADVTAALTQPPAPVSAMDGYAVRAADLAALPATLTRIGQAPAGHPFAGRVDPGECVRIFTGGQVPEGADAILIQEDAEERDGKVHAKESVAPGRYVRPAGLDFKAGDVVLRAGTVLDPRHIGLAAAANRAWLEVRRAPRVAILATGDEIVLPGSVPGPGQIVSSNGPALAAFVRRHGGEAITLPNAPDDADALRGLAKAAAGADLLVTSGGASVGEHDLIRSALGSDGLKLDFWQIAMRPGKPLMFGKLGALPLLGLPGNPVSNLVCATLFLGPMLAALLGRPDPLPKPEAAILGRDLPPNDAREDYLRATLARAADGAWIATPFEKQDSSMISVVARADALAIRPPRAPAAQKGEPIRILRFV